MSPDMDQRFPDERVPITLESQEIQKGVHQPVVISVLIVDVLVIVIFV